MARIEILKQVQERTGTKDAFIVRDIPIGEIAIRQNVRENDGTDIEELKDSIKSVGLLQPITVYKDADDYVCIIGHRRLRAFRELYQEEPDKYHSIKAIVTDGKNIIVRQLIENVQRSDLNQRELYHALKELKGQGLKYRQIAQIIGKSEGYVKNLFSGIRELERDAENMEIFKKSHDVTLSDFQKVKPVKDKSERKKLLIAKAQGKITQRELQQKVTQSRTNHFSANGAEVEILDLLKKNYFTANQLHRLARCIVKEAVSKTQGRDRKAIIETILKIIHKYRGQ